MRQVTENKRQLGIGHVFAPLVAIVLMALVTASAASAATDSSMDEVPTVTNSRGVEMAAGQVVVRFTAESTSGQRAAAINSTDEKSVDPIGDIPRARVIELLPGSSIGETISGLNSRAAVEYAHPNFIVEAQALPNDPMFANLWGLRDTVAPDMDINAEQAWNYTTGSEDVRIAVVDTGVAGTPSTSPLTLDAHPDLVPNMDTNLSRNFVPSGGTIDPDRWYDETGHGTHVAGTIGARGNNGIGVTGVNWNTSLVSVRVLGMFTGTVSDVAAGLDYAGDIDSDVVNVSLGYPNTTSGGVPVSIMRDAISAHPDSLYVLAAGNDGQDQAVDPTYPCQYNLSNAICVASIDGNGSIAATSNYGDEEVHLGAPGVDVLSTFPGSPSGYTTYSGTSMAAPHVTGTAGLVLAMDQGATTQEVKQTLLENVAPTASLVGKTVTEGRLNAADAVQSMTRFSECRVPGGSTYRTFWEPAAGSTIDITDLHGKAASEAFFRDYVDTWGDVSKLEWWTPSTLSSIFTQTGQWGDPGYPGATNSWDYAASWGAADQRTDVLATSPFGFLSPRVSFRTNGSGLARDSDTCDTYLSEWPTGTGKRTVVAGDSMTSQMAKKLLGQSGWKALIEPQSKSSFANMKGEIRGLASGLVDSAVDEQVRPEVMVMALGTKDADAIAALATQPERDAAVTTMRSNIDQVLSATSGVQCRIVVTTHETGYLPNGTYSTPLKDARLAVNAKLRAVANASASVDIVDWGTLSAAHGAHEPAGTRWYEPSDRENPNPAGLTALSNAIINKAQGSCS